MPLACTFKLEIYIYKSKWVFEQSEDVNLFNSSLYGRGAFVIPLVFATLEFSTVIK